MKLKIFPFKKVKSTNSTAIRLINQNIKFGVVTSERQYKGRGQGTNRWISNYGNIFLSIFFPVKRNLSIKNITKINLNVVKKVIKKHINEKINIKLPNDILINQSKICGILQEIIFKNNIIMQLIKFLYILIMKDFNIMISMIGYIQNIVNL